MVFGQGRIPQAAFYINGEELEMVKEFKYLGVILTQQLSYSSHVEEIVAKAKQRVAYLYMRLPMYSMSLDLVIRIFQTYILPIFLYCTRIYAPNLKSLNAIQQLNAVFTNYVKRYLGLPKYANNAAIHYYCGTWPLYNATMHGAVHAVSKINFPPDSLNGYKLSIANVEHLPPYLPEHEMDSDFPKCKVHISRNQIYRRRKFRELFNVNHYKSCSVKKFHVKPTDDCKCIYCQKSLGRGHVCSAI